MQTLTLKVLGMTCDGCSGSIQRTLGELAGVQSVAVDREQEQAVICYDDGVIDANQLIDAIDELGFDVVA